jgi:hypothetical protein
MLSLHSVFAKAARLFISNGGTQATREAADPVIQVHIHQLMKNLSLQELPSETGIRGFKPLQCKSSKLMGGFSLEMDDRMTCCLRGLIHAGPPLLAGHGQLCRPGSGYYFARLTSTFLISWTDTGTVEEFTIAGDEQSLTGAWNGVNALTGQKM